MCHCKSKYDASACNNSEVFLASDVASHQSSIFQRKFKLYSRLSNRYYDKLNDFPHDKPLKQVNFMLPKEQLPNFIVSTVILRITVVYP